jgi:hypothetical protein
MGNNFVASCFRQGPARLLVKRKKRGLKSRLPLVELRCSWVAAPAPHARAQGRVQATDQLVGQQRAGPFYPTASTKTFIPCFCNEQPKPCIQPVWLRSLSREIKTIACGGTRAVKACQDWRFASRLAGKRSRRCVGCDNHPSEKLR